MQLKVLETKITKWSFVMAKLVRGSWEKFIFTKWRAIAVEVGKIKVSSFAHHFTKYNISVI